MVKTSGTSLRLERASFTITTNWTGSTDLRIQRLVVIWDCSTRVRRLGSSWSDVVNTIIWVYAIESRITKSSWRFRPNFRTKPSRVTNSTFRLHFKSHWSTVCSLWTWLWEILVICGVCWDNIDSCFTEKTCWANYGPVRYCWVERCAWSRTWIVGSS